MSFSPMTADLDTYGAHTSTDEGLRRWLADQMRQIRLQAFQCAVSCLASDNQLVANLNGLEAIALAVQLPAGGFSAKDSSVQLEMVGEAFDSDGLLRVYVERVSNGSRVLEQTVPLVAGPFAYKYTLSREAGLVVRMDSMLQQEDNISMDVAVGSMQLSADYTLVAELDHVAGTADMVKKYRAHVIHWRAGNAWSV